LDKNNTAKLADLGVSQVDSLLEQGSKSLLVKITT